jgi:hypothetical protein
MRIFIILTILTLILLGCAIPAHPTQVSATKTGIPTPNISYTASPLPLPTSTNGETEVVSAVTSSPFPRYVFHFGATPQMSQVGGIGGVFYRENTPDETCAQNYSVFRFYDDGLVMSVRICDDDATGNFLDNVWPDIREWFHRENHDTTNPHGVYYIVENEIWFTTVVEYISHIVVTDYLGTYSKDRLILNSFSHYNGHETAEEEFIYLDTTNSP